ncbi:DUF3718 domain-containing protein [Salinimonas chungwhensis]|uniref:DUF3718 domain-containing protein n=1 Tax=Salinimonas chungwhensis TaxID=265425 RepID=UPI000381A180|nr:DUF3718 domain-containing protein [Salinimonas chungwhensis]
MIRCNVASAGLCLLSLSLAGPSIAESYPAEMEKDLIAVCQHAGEDNSLKMHQTVRGLSVGTSHTGPMYRVLVAGLRCNGMTVSQFASYYGAQSTYDVLKRFSPETSVEIKDIQISRLPPENIVVSVAAAR